MTKDKGRSVEQQSFFQKNVYGQHVFSRYHIRKQHPKSEVEVRLIPMYNSHATQTFSVTAYHKSQKTVCRVKIQTPPITL